MNTQRLQQIDPVTATGSTKEFFNVLQSRLGLIPNLARTLAQSPAALDGYLSLNGALAKGALPGRIREQIALTVAAANSCDYCASAHSVLGRLAGLTEAEIASALGGHAPDQRTEAALDFAQVVITKRGRVADADLEAVKNAGYSEGEIAEMVAHVALNTLTNYFNNVAETEIDFPRVHLPQVA